MISEKEMERLKAESMSPEQWKLLKILAVCLVTAMLAGFTVVAMNGTIEWTVHHEGRYNDWDETKTVHFGPVLQWFLGFLTTSFFLLSIYLLMGVHADRSKRS